MNAYYSTVRLAAILGAGIFKHSIVPLQLMLRVGAGARGFSGYGVVGSGLVMDSVLGGMTAGAGVEYRYKKVGFFAEALGFVILGILEGVWTIRGVAGVSVFL